MTDAVVEQEVLRVRLTVKDQPSVMLRVPSPVKVVVRPIGGTGAKGDDGETGPVGPAGPQGPVGPPSPIDPGDLTLIFDNHLI